MKMQAYIRKTLLNECSSQYVDKSMWNQKGSQPLAEYRNMDVESNQDEDLIKTLCAKAQNERELHLYIR